MTYFVNYDVVSIASVTEDTELQEAIIQSDKIRSEALHRCYSMENYKDLPLNEKNKIYDKIVKEVEAELV